jgi:excisionase family DNA binding protein
MTDSYQTTGTSPPLNSVLTPEEAANYLKVNVSFLYERTRKRHTTRGGKPIPYRKMGKYLRFYKHELEQWLNDQMPTVQ